MSSTVYWSTAPNGLVDPRIRMCTSVKQSSAAVDTSMVEIDMEMKSDSPRKETEWGLHGTPPRTVCDVFEETVGLYGSRTALCKKKTVSIIIINFTAKY